MTQSAPRQSAIRILLDAIKNAGWTNHANTAFLISEAIFEDPELLTSSHKLMQILPPVFCVTNRTSAEGVIETLADSQDRLRQLVAIENSYLDRAIIQIGDIDSFSDVKMVRATEVEAFSNPLQLSEDEIEQIIARVVGEPYRQKDWGGELDDLFSAQVRLGGREVTASFMLKGPGLRAKVMKPKDLGKNGDQITRMTRQPAELYVVQFVGGIDSSVYGQLQDAIVAKRASGQPHVVGSVWNGVDTARLAMAYGFLDRETGKLIRGKLGDGDATTDAV